MHKKHIMATICASILLNATPGICEEDFLSAHNLPSEKVDGCKHHIHFPLSNKLSIGPTIFHLQRIRAGGTSQKGWLYGLRASYDKIKRYRLYWGFDAAWSRGTLHGHNGAGDKLKSLFVDKYIEGRLGYTFQSKCNYQPAITPFVGYGYFDDINKFQEPSPLLVKFVTSYRYICYGFLSSIAITEQLNIGLNFKGWAPLHARTKVEDDDEQDHVKMLMGDRFNYRLELPILYRYCACNEHLEIGLVPFYEFRHYGSRENYPFDYADTKFHLCGLNIQLTYRL